MASLEDKLTDHQIAALKRPGPIKFVDIDGYSMIVTVNANSMSLAKAPQPESRDPVQLPQINHRGGNLQTLVIILLLAEELSRVVAALRSTFTLMKGVNSGTFLPKVLSVVIRILRPGRLLPSGEWQEPSGGDRSSRIDAIVSFVRGALPDRYLVWDVESDAVRGPRWASWTEQVQERVLFEHACEDSREVRDACNRLHGAASYSKPIKVEVSEDPSAGISGPGTSTPAPPGTSTSAPPSPVSSGLPSAEHTAAPFPPFPGVPHPIDAHIAYIAWQQYNPVYPPLDLAPQAMFRQLAAQRRQAWADWEAVQNYPRLNEQRSPAVWQAEANLDWFRWTYIVPLYPPEITRQWVSRPLRGYPAGL